MKIFRVAQERFRLNSSKYEQVIMTICDCSFPNGNLLILVIKIWTWLKINYLT
ncbi:hypothetical protein [Cylindrospermopsis raciborskii]|uniref:hypothetical protein n=1 Tax=Cylindrospermopsis raciborskii TaxID=77022 RepID=UPI00215A6F25|nr:hypothetical protein [Cylindrospermopsis raciborskii]